MTINYFIMICSDAEDILGRKHSALDVTKSRLNKSMWPLYSGTSNRRKLKQGDICFFYLAGKMELSQCLISKAKIREIKTRSFKDDDIDSQDLLTKPSEQIIYFDDVKHFNPISIRVLLDKFSFTKNITSNWGGSFQGGCKLISTDDSKLIMNEISAHI